MMKALLKEKHQTPGERTEVESIANQCLFPDGRGVSYARGLQTWLTRKPARYADDCVDTQTPGERKGITEANKPAVSVRLYPNPARGSVTMDNLMPGATLEIYDAKGAKVAGYAIESASLTVSTANLRGGVYLFRFLNGGTVIDTEKVNILD